MADTKLSDGTEINFDLTKLTWKEWCDYWDVKSSNEETQRIITKVTGLPKEKFTNMLFNDMKRINKAFSKKGSEPLFDPS